jgi:hypothetical protein
LCTNSKILLQVVLCNEFFQIFKFRSTLWLLGVNESFRVGLFYTWRLINVALGLIQSCAHINVHVNPQMPPAPICGVWKTLKPPITQEEVIFHPRFLGQLGRQALHHIQLKNHFGRSPSFYKNEFCKKKDDCVVYS